VIFFLSQKPRKPRSAERDCDAIDSSYLVKEICEATQRLSSGGRASRDNLRENKSLMKHTQSRRTLEVFAMVFILARFDLDHNSQRSVWH
jgi:hypothetical protein